MDWTNVLNQIFEFSVIPLLSILSATLIAVVVWKKNQVLKETNNEMAKQYIEMLDDTIIDCVLATNQTYVETLKKEGTFTAEAQKVAFKKTFDAVLNILSEHAKEYLNVAIKDLNGYITNKIEATVISVKY